MIQIRRNTFETNSSSTHSLVMCMKKDYNLWMKDKLWFIDCGAPSFVPWENVIKFMREHYSSAQEDIETLISEYEKNNMETVEDILSDYEIYSYSAWLDHSGAYERYSDSFITPSGDEVVAFGFFGSSY